MKTNRLQFELFSVVHLSVECKDDKFCLQRDPNSHCLTLDERAQCACKLNYHLDFTNKTGKCVYGMYVFICLLQCHLISIFFILSLTTFVRILVAEWWTVTNIFCFVILEMPFTYYRFYFVYKKFHFSFSFLQHSMFVVLISLYAKLWYAT